MAVERIRHRQTRRNDKDTRSDEDFARREWSLIDGACRQYQEIHDSPNDYSVQYAFFHFASHECGNRRMQEEENG